MKQLKQDIIDYKIPIIIIIIGFICLELIFGMICPFKILTGFDCPGCGLTRATLALLRGDIKSSLHYNYTCILWLLTIILFIIDRYIKPLKVKPFPVLFIITGIITLIRYILIIVFNMPIF